MNYPDLVCASEEEEFFYEGSDLPVEEGDPVGVELENGDNIDLVLFSNIYWALPAIDDDSTPQDQDWKDHLSRTSPKRGYIL
jgi:hypothetical protein